jgi:hypothetical protein
MQIRLVRGDCRAVVAQLRDQSIDSIVTDAPYEIRFAGEKWDATGIAFDVELWRDAMRAAKPGAHLAAFGCARTYHRMVCAIEDAGWEIRDTLLWLYGTGVPKSKRTTLKPAYEPIVLARRPFSGRLADNLAQFGTGALNIEQCRIGDEARRLPAAPAAAAGIFGARRARRAKIVIGRWPTNLLLDEEAAAAVDAASSPAQASRLFYVAKASTKERGERQPSPDGEAHVADAPAGAPGDPAERLGARPLRRFGHNCAGGAAGAPALHRL